MKPSVIITSLFLLSILVSCTSISNNEPDREDREQALLRTASNEVVISLLELSPETDVISLNLKHARIEIPRDNFPGDLAKAEEKLNADGGRLNEGLKSFLDLDDIGFLIGIDVFELQSLMEEGKVGVYDRENERYLDSLVMADYSIYYGPLNSTAGVVFLFPDKKRVIIEIMRWIS